ncbi:ABC transporter permease [Nocardioides sp. Kera G14]|uniref:ABC transporter permease n=1 Tax=Nocardioides sp. Kera G14 TaxID=2884264 RepID=UPI001D0F5001|nr:ABC transporter permease subunit [Nocardioides sp. Kera G14]UDY22907.1 ABC transporter permease subunit [Nocardioides sp. Kera G14]
MTRLRRWLPALALLPFLAYVFAFLLEPTIEVLVGAFQDKDGAWTFDSLGGVFDPVLLTALRHSVILAVTSAIGGAVLGAMLAAVVVSMPAHSLLRRWIMGMAGVFAQFGGVTLAFLFISTFAANGFLTRWADAQFGIDLYGGNWIATLKGLIVIYLYFQIPLMVIVFIPALEGMRQEWREAAVNLGATRWQYFVQVVVPVLRPAFLGAFLLLFANGFAAYATAAAMIQQGTLILPMAIRSSLSSEVSLGHEHLAYAVALEMVVIVALVMFAYSVLLKRTSRWLS